MKPIFENDADSVKKFAAKLCKSLKNEHGIVLGQSKMLHSIAKAVGYNNWHVMSAKIPRNDKKSYNPRFSSDVFKYGTPEEITNLISLVVGVYLPEKTTSDEWKIQALRCVTLISKVYVYCRDNDIGIPAPSYKETGRLDFLAKIVLSSKNDAAIVRDIKDYFFSLAGWHEGLWIDMTPGVGGAGLQHIYELHGYRTMQYENYVHDLETEKRNALYFIEDNDSQNNLYASEESIFLFEYDEKFNTEEKPDNFFEKLLHDGKALLLGIPGRGPNKIIMKLDEYGMKGETISLTAYHRRLQ